MVSNEDTKLSKNEYIKQRTLEIYDSMPQDKELRKKCFKERDEIIELNYAFFGYVASHTFINNSSVEYEDKLQSALLHFCECFWWYKWKGDETHKGYRQDLAFTVFYKPRIAEMIERELNEVKYSLRRTLCMEVGSQLNKHWGKVTYEDLSNPNLHISDAKMQSLKAIFGTLYVADLADHETYIEAPKHHISIVERMNDEYDSVEELLIHEMVQTEKRLTENKLQEMSNIYQISIHTLRSALPRAEAMLYTRLKQEIDIMDI